MINSNVTGLPTLSALGSNVASYIGPNEIVGTFKYGTGPNFLFITNIVLQQNGLIYVIVGDVTVWTRDPVVS